MKKMLTTTAGLKSIMALVLLMTGLAIGGCQREAGARAEPIDTTQPTPPRRGSY